MHSYLFPLVFESLFSSNVSFSEDAWLQTSAELSAFTEAHSYYPERILLINITLRRFMPLLFADVFQRSCVRFYSRCKRCEIKISPLFGSSVSTEGGHHPLSTEPLASCSPHRREPGKKRGFASSSEVGQVRGYEPFSNEVDKSHTHIKIQIWEQEEKKRWTSYKYQSVLGSVTLSQTKVHLHVLFAQENLALCWWMFFIF